MRRASPLVLVALLITACSSKGTGGGTGGHGGTSTGKDAGADAKADAPQDAPADVTYDVTVVPPPDGSIKSPCNLPGSVQFTSSGTLTVPGGGS